MRHGRATDGPGAEGATTVREDHPAIPAGDGDTLARACSTQHRASLLGFDWDDPREALAKVREETAEVAALLAPAPDEATRSKLQEEVGDLLFAVVNVARLAGVDPGVALDLAARKFTERFREVVRLAGKRGLPMPGTPLEPLDRLWDEAKAGAADGPRPRSADVPEQPCGGSSMPSPGPPPASRPDTRRARR